jgi:hypothetical protein
LGHWPHLHGETWGEKPVGGGGVILATEGSVVGLYKLALV